MKNSRGRGSIEPKKYLGAFGNVPDKYCTFRKNPDFCQPKKVKISQIRLIPSQPRGDNFNCLDLQISNFFSGFGWSHHLAKHEMNVHVRTRPYKCSVQGCNWAFNDLSNRNMHERRVHKLGAPPKR